jgi:hypothetical protein
MDGKSCRDSTSHYAPSQGGQELRRAPLSVSNLRRLITCSRKYTSYECTGILHASPVQEHVKLSDGKLSSAALPWTRHAAQDGACQRLARHAVQNTTSHDAFISSTRDQSSRYHIATCVQFKVELNQCLAMWHQQHGEHAGGGEQQMTYPPRREDGADHRPRSSRLRTAHAPLFSATCMTL